MNGMFIYDVFQSNTCIALISDSVSAVVCELYNLRLGSVWGTSTNSNFNHVVENKRYVLQPLCLVLSDYRGILQRPRLPSHQYQVRRLQNEIHYAMAASPFLVPEDHLEAQKSSRGYRALSIVQMVLAATLVAVEIPGKSYRRTLRLT